ncbi:hypothetical protein O3P69_013521 [Scylla paramamosain]|uniref:RRM domain-containing protein n=1 Tax=Scylla paramamosain TaxID=85552 RepID=A0AAW0SA99_SCYPA
MSYGRGPPDIKGMTSLKVDNLTYRTTPEDLRRSFEKYGYYDRRDAEDAMEAMDGRRLDGRELRVQMARYGRRRHPRTAAAAVVARTALDQGHAQGHAVGAAAGQGLAPGQGRGQGHAVATLGQGVTAGAERGREPTLVQEASLLLVLPKNTRTPQLVPLPTTTTTTTALPPPLRPEPPREWDGRGY